MAQARWQVIVPLGTLTVSGAGSTVLLSANCGPLGGQTGTDWKNPPVPGQSFRQIMLINADSGGNAFLLPRGSTASGNPGNIITIIPSGGLPIYIPSGQPFENGILPENFVLDCDAACTVYGFGILS